MAACRTINFTAFAAYHVKKNESNIVFQSVENLCHQSLVVLSSYMWCCVEGGIYMGEKVFGGARQAAIPRQLF